MLKKTGHGRVGDRDDPNSKQKKGGKKREKTPTSCTFSKNGDLLFSTEKTDFHH